MVSFFFLSSSYFTTVVCPAASTATYVDQISKVTDAHLAKYTKVAEPVSTPSYGGGTSSSSAPTPDYARQAKAQNDYLYGSGRASSCPFSSYICR